MRQVTLAILIALLSIMQTTAEAVEKIVFSSNESGNYDIWMMNPDGTNKQQITNSPVDEVCPVLSHNGLYIAFVRWDAGTYHGNLYSYSIQDYQIVQLTTDNSAAASSWWNPEDTKLTFDVWCSAGRYIAVYDLQTSATSPLTDCTNGTYSPVWHPTDNHVYYIDHKPCGWGVFRVPVSGGTPERVDSLPFHTEPWVFNPVYSDSVVMVVRTADCWVGQVDLAIYTISDDSLEIILPGGDQEELPRWSPDRMKIVYELGIGGSHNIQVLDLLTHQTTNLTAFTGLTLMGLDWGRINGGSEPSIVCGDVNCDYAVDISDPVYLIQYIFAGGPVPCAGCR